MANTTNIDLVKPAGTDHALISVLNGNSDKIDAEAGRQRGNFAGTYSTTSGYAVGDYCIYQGNLYRCTTAIGSSGENWTAAHWTQTKAGTELKGLSDQIAPLIGTTKWGDWTELTPTGGENWNGSYWCKIGKVTYLVISVKGLTANTNTNILSLPNGCLPLFPIEFDGFGGLAYLNHAHFKILSNGTVSVYSADTYAVGFISYPSL